MSVYVIVSYDIADPKLFETYFPGVVPLLQKHGAEILVVDSEAKTLEGESRDVNVVVRFESEEAAMNWYNDPGYVPVKKIRIDSTENATLALAKQFVPPSS